MANKKEKEIIETPIEEKEEVVKEEPKKLFSQPKKEGGTRVD